MSAPTWPCPSAPDILAIPSLRYTQTPGRTKAYRVGRSGLCRRAGLCGNPCQKVPERPKPTERNRPILLGFPWQGLGLPAVGFALITQRSSVQIRPPQPRKIKGLGRVVLAPKEGTAMSHETTASRQESTVSWETLEAWARLDLGDDHDPAPAGEAVTLGGVGGAVAHMHPRWHRFGPFRGRGRSHHRLRRQNVVSSSSGNFGSTRDRSALTPSPLHPPCRCFR